MEYLVIDIGTSSLRVLLMDEKTEITASRVRPLHIPAVADAERLWMHLCAMAKELNLTEHKVAAVVVSSLLGWVGTDRSGTAVTPCYTYAHTCEDVYQQDIWDQMGARVYSLTGRRPNPELGAFQLRYIRKHDLDAYRRIAAFLTLKDYVNQKLTGRAAMDRTSAGYTMAYEIGAGRWCGELLSLLETDGEKLPELVSPARILGGVSPAAAREMGLAEGTPVAVGSVDGSTGILGAGGLESGTLVSVMGTTDTSFLVTDRPLRDPSCSLVLNPHVVPGRWLLGGPMGMYGGAAEWLQSTLLGGGKSLEALTAEAEKLPRGSEGLFFFPTLAGERAPFWQPALRGTVAGLEARHTGAHLLRGILEANACVLKHMTDLMRAAGGSISQIISIGGGSRNDLWLQIKAEVLGLPVIRTDVREATARGSCLLAQMALGHPASTRLEARQVFQGTMEAVEEYQTFCRCYLNLHDKAVGLYPTQQT